MARLTNVEKAAARALVEAQQAEEEKARLAAMPMTLLTLMARATTCGLDHRIEFNANGDVMVRINDKYGDHRVVTLVSPRHVIADVEFDIKCKEEEVAEQRALEERRQAARAKLTDEDLEALGLR